MLPAPVTPRSSCGSLSAAPELDGPEQGVWLDHIAAEHDNLHVALDWASDQPGEATALRLAALRPFWDARGHYTVGRAW